MQKSNKHSITSLGALLDYLADKLPGRKAHALEKKLLDDPFEQDALDGLSQLSEEEIVADMASIKKALNSHSKERTVSPWMRIAASIALIMTTGIAIWFVVDIGLNDQQDVSQKVPAATSDTLDNKAQDFDSVRIPSSEPLALNQAQREEINQRLKENVSTPSAPVQVSTKAKAQELIAMEMVEPKEEIDLDVALDEEMLDELAFSLSEREPEETQLMDEVVAEGEAASKRETASGAIAMAKQEDNKKTARRSKNAHEEAPLAATPAMAPEASVTDESPIPTSEMAKKAEQANELLAKDDTKVVRGKVLSVEDDMPLPGVSVTVKGTNAGTVTNMNGEYEIKLPSEKSTLVYSNVGYKTEEISPDSGDEIDLEMVPDISSLSEIVVIGYGVQKEEDHKPVTRSPIPTNGIDFFKDYLENNMRYPDDPGPYKKVVRLKLTISEDGIITDIKVTKSEGEFFDKEAVRLIKEGPWWSPALDEDKPIEGSVIVRVVFKKD